MRVGVPKEIKLDEFRVGLTPAAAREFITNDHEVLIETGAGAGIGESDDAYVRAGARIVTADEVFRRAEMIVKVKEPQPAEWSQLREGQILFTYLHLAADLEQTKGLLNSGCTAVAYETVRTAAGQLPLLAPMSEVAGRLSVEAAAACLRKTSGGPGLLMGGVPGVAPARIVILGGGVVGLQAARMATGMGADVVVMDRSLPRLRQLDDLFSGRIVTQYASQEAVERETARADVVIGAVLIAGAKAPKLISKKSLSELRKGVALVDVAIDQGGCFETSRPTTHSNPTYLVDGVTHYCVANMPGAVPRTSSAALCAATLPYGLAIAAQGLDALNKDVGLRAGLNVHRGRLTNRAVAQSLDLNWVDLDLALAS